MGTHSAFTRAGAMGSRESALIVLRAFLQYEALLSWTDGAMCVVECYVSGISRGIPLCAKELVALGT